MVLEHLLPAEWLEKKKVNAFVLGAGTSIIGIFIASLLFPKDPSLTAVAFTSILLLPLLRRLFTIEERQEKHEKKFSLRALLHDEGDFIMTYFLVVAGIFIMYALASIILPSFSVNSLFEGQLGLRSVQASGQAILDNGLFMSILLNNWWVLIACFFMSLLTGDGAIFLLTWNASLWGAIFGVTARNAAIYSHTNPYWYLLLVLLIVGPHAILEILSYIIGGIAGGLISADIEVDKGERKKDRFKRVFYSYTGALILASIVLLFVGAAVETFVLQYATTYQHIVQYSLIVAAG